MKMDRVFVASPWRVDWRVQDRKKGAVILRNKQYALSSMSDSLARGESPYLPHLLYPQVLTENRIDRALGMMAGQSFLRVCDLLAVYVDLGVSEGMKEEMKQAMRWAIPVEERKVPGWPRDSAI